MEILVRPCRLSRSFAIKSSFTVRQVAGFLVTFLTGYFSDCEVSEILPCQGVSQHHFNLGDAATVFEFELTVLGYSTDRSSIHDDIN
jgi:hypothetical protein